MLAKYIDLHGLDARIIKDLKGNRALQTYEKLKDVAKTQKIGKGWPDNPLWWIAADYYRNIICSRHIEILPRHRRYAELEAIAIGIGKFLDIYENTHPITFSTFLIAQRCAISAPPEFCWPGGGNDSGDPLVIELRKTKEFLDSIKQFEDSIERLFEENTDPLGAMVIDLYSLACRVTKFAESHAIELAKVIDCYVRKTKKAPSNKDGVWNAARYAIRKLKAKAKGV